MLLLHSLTTVLALSLILTPVAMKQDPELASAEASFQAGDLASAAKQCRNILNGNPAHPDALHLLGKISFIAAKSITDVSQSLQAYGEAERSFRQLLKVSPERNETRIQQTLAICMQQRGAPLQALQFATNATRLGPKNSNAFRILGECASDLGRTDQAITALQTAHDLAPANVDVVWLLTREFKTAKKPHKALAILEKTISSLPDNSPHRATLYQLMYENYLASNDTVGALSAIEKMVAGDPENASGVIELAATLYRLGKFEDAKASAQKARSLQSRDPKILSVIALKLGQILVHEQNYVEAVTELQSAVRHDPASLEALQAYAGALRRTGQDAKARSILESYKEIRTASDALKIHIAAYRSQPNDRSAQEQVIRCLITISDYEKAQKELIIRQRKFPDDSATGELIRLLTRAKAR